MKIAVGVPKKHSFVPEQHLIGEMIWGLRNRGHQVLRVDGNGKHEAATNRIFLSALELEVDIVIKIDADMLPPSGKEPNSYTFIENMIQKCIEPGVGVVFPVQHKAQGNMWPCPLILMEEKENFWGLKVKDKYDEWEKVDACGSGMMVIDTNLLKEMKKPWFILEFTDEDCTKQLGADLMFCKRALALGFQPTVYTRAVCGHIKGPIELSTLNMLIHRMVESAVNAKESE